MKVETPFPHEILELGIIKLLALNTYHILAIKVKFERNEMFRGITNDSTQDIVLDPKRAIASLDIRLLG